MLAPLRCRPALNRVKCAPGFVRNGGCNVNRVQPALFGPGDNHFLRRHILRGECHPPGAFLRHLRHVRPELEAPAPNGYSAGVGWWRVWRPSAARCHAKDRQWPTGGAVAAHGAVVLIGRLLAALALVFVHLAAADARANAVGQLPQAFSDIPSLAILRHQRRQHCPLLAQHFRRGVLIDGKRALPEDAHFNASA